MENCNGYSLPNCMSLMYGQQKMTDHMQLQVDGLQTPAVSQAECISELTLIQRETKLV